MMIRVDCAYVVECPKSRCHNMLYGEEKQRLRDEEESLKEKSAEYADAELFFRSQWEEIGNGVWIDPIRVYAAQKDAKAKTAFASMVLMFLYKTEELEGKRLHKLDQDIVHAITGWHLIYIYICSTKNELAVVTKLLQVKLKESGSTGDQPKKKAPKDKALILQAKAKEKRLKRRAAMRTDLVVQNLAAE
ncbi:hypothetical protein pdam_00014737 [Pocillopora damicornis]|uniref:Uncharacterized protein n=1 Tax=Pocillopora damicornis TaxID=46731 RepID=A0A3M6U480_POCDA|nr:hypothetical protein pdam_00014737 [Pocillopora damicornis]